MATAGPFKAAYDEHHAEMRRAFDLVGNMTHWKGPIDAEIDAAERGTVADAVEYFTATTATFAPAGEGKLRCTAPGYWAGPAN